MVQNIYIKALAKRIILIPLFVFVLFSISFSVSALVSTNARKEFRRKIIELRYNSSRLVSTYGETKNKIKLLGISDEVDQVSLYITRGLRADTGSDKKSIIKGKRNSVLIGKRTRDVIKDRGGNYVEFKIQTPDVSGIEELNFKLFSRNKDSEEESYSVHDTFKAKINNIACLKIKHPVCAQPVELSFIKELGAYEEKELSPRTYDNFCEVQRDEARFLHYGAC